MVWINICVVVGLIGSFFMGFLEKAVNPFSFMVGLFITIPLTGISYRFLAWILSFLPGENWENFVGFLVTFCVIWIIISTILMTISSIIERLMSQQSTGKARKESGLSRLLVPRLLGGIFMSFCFAVFGVILDLVARVYPITGWVEAIATSPGIHTWLVSHLSFVASMLPEIFQEAVTIVAVFINLM